MSLFLDSFGDQNTPVSKVEFAHWMAKFAPFEPFPHLAVAVSGGSDSLALTLLAHEWARIRGGQITALTIDHQLRPSSAQEAQQVKGWLEKFGITTVILNWEGKKTSNRIQEKAREARYHLLEIWCRTQGVLHLLVGHHFEDQQETVEMRNAKNTGKEGLAGMSVITEKPYYRILRPLLSCSKKRLQTTLRSKKQLWIEDPSNQNIRFKRVELRQNPYKFTMQDLQAFGQERQRSEEVLNTLIPYIVTPFSAGYALLTFKKWASLEPELQRGVLQRALMTYGTSPYSPSRESLSTLIYALQETACTRTLNGCLIKHYRREFLLVAREPGLINHTTFLTGRSGSPFIWDHRFLLTLPPLKYEQATLKALGQKGWEIVKPYLKSKEGSPPYPVSLSLPSIWYHKELIAIPPFFDLSLNQTFTLFKENAIKFLPRYPLTRFKFTIA